MCPLFMNVADALEFVERVSEIRLGGGRGQYDGHLECLRLGHYARSQVEKRCSLLDERQVPNSGSTTYSDSLLIYLPMLSLA
jgi:hypothetical protein